MSRDVRHFFDIIPLIKTGSKLSVFTYHYEQPLQIGQIVEAPFGKKKIRAIVKGHAARPSFTTKAISGTLDLPTLPSTYIDLMSWLAQYYAVPLSRVATHFIPKLTKKRQAVAGRTLPRLPKTKQPPLTLEQANVLKTIGSSEGRSFLLRGVTNSGKTRVYIELAKKALQQGRSALILVPEIALGTQIAARFYEVFGRQVLITNSDLSVAQRRIIWQQILEAKEPVVVVGPRSALFMPFQDLGLIVIDEAHDQSYKSEQIPRYHATMVAAQLRNLHDGRLVLGSATPAVADYYLAREGKLTLLEMSLPVHGEKPRPSIEVVDMKAEPRGALISNPLLKALRQNLENKKQSLLFINRRGSARLMVCGSCGWSALCPSCQIPMTAHTDTRRLICHWCGQSQQLPNSCPECDSLDLRLIGSGTKRLVEEVEKRFPAARIGRLDRDSKRTTDISELFESLQNQEIDILIGTQMITKGLDFPGIATVGIITAESLMYLPDFSSSERSFQLLHQVAGRAGRSREGSGATIIQTFMPDHPLFDYLKAGAYQDFAEHELSERRAHHYPPFSFLLRIEVRKASAIKAQELLEEIAQELKGTPGIAISGPAPAFRETIGGHFTWQLLVRCAKRSALVKIATQLPATVSFDLDPVSLL